MDRNSIQTIGELLEWCASSYGEKDFFKYQGEAYTYAEFDEQVTAIANKLYEHSISDGDIICLYMYNRPEYLYMLFALAKVGAVAAPIDTRFTGDVLAHVLTEIDAETVILDDDTETEYAAVRSDLPTITTEFFVGNDIGSSPYRDFDVLTEGDASTAPPVTVSGTDPFSVTYVQRYLQPYPKGVVLPHYSYINTGTMLSREILNLDRSDCIFTTLPFYSTYPIQMGVMGALIAGSEFAFEKQFDKDRFWDWIRRYDATVFLYLGRMLSVLHNQPAAECDDNNAASYAIGHGFGFESDETMIANFERRFDVTTLEAYGITPTATLATSNRPDDRRLGSVGKPVSHAEVKIVDENDWEVPTGESGEILVQPTETNTMLRGFFDDAELTAELCRNQWIHTNDIGYVDEDGYLYFVASKTNTIHLGRVAGQISSLEIESVIESHPDIRNSVVLGVQNDNGNEDIKAVVVPVEGADPNPVKISEHCEKQLTYQKLPRYIEIRDEIPRSTSGKVRKQHLRDTISPDVWSRDSGYELLR